MQVTTERKVLDRIPAERQANYHINPSATIHITRILRNMYQDPIRAVVREYVSNAIDAHREAGVSEPIKVSLPTKFEASFSVRDYGPGLDEEAIEKLLLGYGASGDYKHKSNDQIGGFGIGCKCAFAVSDTFVYTSWHGGYEQTWLCALDNKDMGTAKQISKVPSDEPTGLRITIPTVETQLDAYHKQAWLSLRFAKLPIRINGEMHTANLQYDRLLSGCLNSTVDGATFELLTFPAEKRTNSIIAVMGDMWYAVDIEQLTGVFDCKVIKLLSLNTHTVCVIHTPINSLSIAPTREGLQYDVHTCSRLITFIKNIDSELNEEAKKQINCARSKFNALHTAMNLHAQGIYTLSRSQPAIDWNNKQLNLKRDFGIKAEPHASGARLYCITNDTIKPNSGRTRSYTLSRNGPAASTLATRIIELTAKSYPSEYPINSITTASDLSAVLIRPPLAYSRNYYYAGQRHQCNVYNVCNSSSNSDSVVSKLSDAVIPIIAYGLTSKSAELPTDTFVLLRPLPLYKVIPDVPVLYYGRKLLKNSKNSNINKPYAPFDGNMCLILEGNAAQCKAFLKDYPWLADTVNAIPDLPVKESTLKRAKAGMYTTDKSDKKSKKPKAYGYELFKYAGANSFTAPSNNWHRVLKADLPSKSYLGVFLSRMIPVSGPTPTGVSLGQQFCWLDDSIALMSALKGKKIDVFGIRPLNGRTPNELPPKFNNYYDALKNELDRWMDPSTVGKYPIHGTQLMLRYGSAGHKSVKYNYGVRDGLLGAFRRPSMANTPENMVHLIDLVRIPDTWQQILKKCKPDSQIVKFGHALKQQLGPVTEAHEAKLNELAIKLVTLITTAKFTHDYNAHFNASHPSEAVLDNVNRYLEPIHKIWRDTWDAYKCLKLLDAIPLFNSDNFKIMLDYIQLVDEDKNTKRAIHTPNHNKKRDCNNETNSTIYTK